MLFWMLVGLLLVGTSNVGAANQPIRCATFASGGVPSPAPQTDSEAVARFQAISQEAKARSHRIVFLGDSLIQKWEVLAWHQHFAPLDVLNAGVNGDRTENLLWRIKHGDLDRQQPELVVVLIGTNDIGHNRPINIIAEGIREILITLRSGLPGTRILLLGVLPRSETSGSERRQQVAAVNQLTRTCADNQYIFYANVGDALLDQTGRLTRQVSPDGVHLSERGYVLLSERLERELASLRSQ